MISDNFTTLTNPTVTDIVMAFDNSLGSIFVFVILFAIMIVLGLSLYSVNQDFLTSFLYANFFVSISGFMLTITRDSQGVALLGFEKLTIFIVFTVLLFIARKMGD